MSKHREQNTPSVTLKPGREKSVRQRHPWIFSGAIASVQGTPSPGAVVDVRAADGAFLARGYYNPRSQIVVRLLTWEEHEAIDRAFWERRLRAALARRDALTHGATNAYRLVFAESDGLPGLIVDRYDRWLVFQALTWGIAVAKPLLVELLQELVAPRGIYERSDVDVRAQEGLEPSTGLLAGEEPPEKVAIVEHGLHFAVDLRHGHKTGFYLDQRENRRAVAAYAAGRDVLNVFSYTGAFAVYAAAHGARSVTNLDSSTEALRAAEEHLRVNGLARETDRLLAGDAFQVLRALKEQGERFDLVILDPPKFAFSRGQVLAATRGYKDINLLGLSLLRPGGILATFSCSGLVSEDLFQKVVFGASLDVSREVRILQRLGQGPDHPVLLTFPEAAYLKGFLCLVD